MHKDIEQSLIPIIGVIISLFLFWLNFVGFLSTFTSLSVITYQKIKQDIYQSTRHTGLRFQSLINLSELKYENIRLRKELTQLQHKIQDLEYKCQLTSPSDSPLLIVQILNYPKPGYLVAYSPNIITAVSENNAYITTPTEDLIGKVEAIKKHWIIIQTIYAKSTQWLVFLPKTKEYGILTYTNSGLKISEIPINSNLAEGDSVYLYSPDTDTPIYVGKVAQVTKDHTQPYLDVTITTAWKLNDLNKLRLIMPMDGKDK